MRRWICFAALAGLAAAAATAQAAEAAGYVLSLDGRWSLQGSATPLAVGSPVPEGARVVASAPVESNRITIVAARGGALLLAQRCRPVTDCAQPLALRSTRAAEAPGLLARVVTRLSGEPDRYVTTLSRGAAPLADAVLASGPGGVDLGPALTTLQPGRYALQLVPLACRGGAPCEPVAALPVHERQPGQPALLPAVAAGVYELVVMPVPGTAVPPRPNSRVLLTAAAAQPALAERLAAGVALTASWGSEVDLPTKRAFVHALLDVLAEP